MWTSNSYYIIMRWTHTSLWWATDGSGSDFSHKRFSSQHGKRWRFKWGDWRRYNAFTIIELFYHQPVNHAECVSSQDKDRNAVDVEQWVAQHPEQPVCIWLDRYESLGDMRYYSLLSRCWNRKQGYNEWRACGSEKERTELSLCLSAHIIQC